VADDRDAASGRRRRRAACARWQMRRRHPVGPAGPLAGAAGHSRRRLSGWRKLGGGGRRPHARSPGRRAQAKTARRWAQLAAAAPRARSAVGGGRKHARGTASAARSWSVASIPSHSGSGGGVEGGGAGQPRDPRCDAPLDPVGAWGGAARLVAGVSSARRFKTGPSRPSATCGARGVDGRLGTSGGYGSTRHAGVADDGRSGREERV